jgi:hypothetical protein
MSRHGTCHLPLPLLEMDETVAKCRTKHLISPKGGTRRCVCCRRVGKKYDTYRADATAMPGPASHKDHGSNSRSAASPGKKGCAGAEAMHFFPGRINNDINIAIPCSHLPLTAKRNSDSGGVGKEG